MDSDDFIQSKALETLYNIAEETQAEVVMCKKHFEVPGNVENFFDNRYMVNSGNEDFEWLTDDFSLRCVLWLERKFQAAVWLKFSRKDFLIDNNIEFIPVEQEDQYWNLEVLFSVKKMLLVPLAFYIYRRELPNSLQASILNKELSPNSIRKKIDRVVNGLKQVDEFLGSIEFFRQNPGPRCFIINHIIQENINLILKYHSDVLPVDIYENLKQAFSKETGQFDVLICSLIVNLIEEVKNFNKLKKEFDDFKQSKSEIGTSNKKKKRKK